MGTEILACRICGKVHQLQGLAPGYVAECSRCGSVLRKKTPYTLHLTAAFSLCALLLYGPANFFPILRMSMSGSVSENTVFSGVVRFYQDGDYFVAIVVFLASILIPFLKILGLFFLTILTQMKSKKTRLFRVKMFRLIEMLGRWAMLDVFALAILVSLVKLGSLATVIAGRGAFAFVLVIVFTLMASASFDAHLIWNEEEI